MATPMEKLYGERLKRYVTAMRNQKPDRIPIRPFVAEFTAKYAGFTCQEVTHDYEKAFVAARKCAAEFDWDAVVSNMVYVWTGLTEAIGLKYYAVPGIHIPPDTGFQYREPAEDEAFMRADEYDHLIDDPTGFLFNTWLPRVSADVVASGCPNTYRNNLSFLKGGMAMLAYFNAFGRQHSLLRSESGTVPAIAGILKAPFDIIADKLRGYIGLSMDVMERPKKVQAACEALAPHLLHVAKTSADPACEVPIGFWMHRGCVPFVSPETFKSLYWPTLKPIIEELWRDKHQTLFYAEGNWDHHLDSFAELPEASIVYHVDQGNIFEVHRRLGHRFCLSGGIPNFLLSYGTADQVRECCKNVIDGVAGDGGYIMDASAIMQNDTDPDNLRALTDFTRDYGVYSSSSSSTAGAGSERGSSSTSETKPPAFLTAVPSNPRANPGVCIPWDEKARELPGVTGDPSIIRDIWQNLDGLGNMYIWQCLLSF